MNQPSIRKPNGDFDWDYLSGKDLESPTKENFVRYFVYKQGKVLVSKGTLHDLQELLVQHEAEELSNPVKTLKGSGHLVEEVFQKDEYNAARQVYGTELAKREAEFRKELFEQEGVAGNPKVEVCYEKAYARSHSAGFREVASTFIDLVELIRP